MLSFPSQRVHGMPDEGNPIRQSVAADGSDSLSILVPTRNEAANVEQLLRRISAAVAGVRTEILFVDDSDDDTPAAIRAAAQVADDCSVVLLHRRRELRWGGLSGAVVDGLRLASGQWVCIMDADLQHPPEAISRLLTKAKHECADLVIASRYSDQGDAAGLNAGRTLISRACTAAARCLFPLRLRGVSDPMSGFFLVRRAAVDTSRLQPRGFKILLELLVRSGDLRTDEVGFVFASRHAGESKGSLHEGLTYLRRLCELRLGLQPGSEVTRGTQAPTVEALTATAASVGKR
jgi:dolichol-phosphate mannosyltransferase